MVRGKRDQAILAILVGCGLRRLDIVSLKLEQFQERENYWVIVNLLEKGNKTRTVTVPSWVVYSVKEYLNEMNKKKGILFTRIYGNNSLITKQLSGNVIVEIVKKYGELCGFSIAPHDLRRTYAKLSYKNGAKLDQIQLNLGHQSLPTTEVYLGPDLGVSDSPGSYIDFTIFDTSKEFNKKIIS